MMVSALKPVYVGRGCHNALFASMAKDRGIIEKELPDFITLKADGGALVVIGGIFVPKNALAHFTTLSPIKQTLGDQIG